jgi:hypothetical protein
MIYSKLKLLPTHKKVFILSFLGLNLLTTTGTAITTVNPVYAQQNIAQHYTNNLIIDLTLYGLNSTAGQIFAFITAHGKIQATTFNATKLDSMDNTVDGIGHYTFILSNVILKPGEPFTTCIVIPSYVKMTCMTDYKAPYPRPQYVDMTIR